MGPLYFAIVLGCVALISGDNVKCPTKEITKEFDVEKYVGDWYNIKNPKNYALLPNTNCDAAQYKKSESGAFDMTRSMCVFDNKVSIAGTIAEESKDSLKKGQLSVKFPKIAKDEENKYYVLDTDYESYSIVWSCKETGSDPNIQHNEYLWVLGRTSTFTNEQKTELSKKLKTLQLNEETLTDVVQKECCYDITKSDDDDNSAASVGLSMALLLSTVMVRFL